MRNCIILGSGRSGTSMVAGLFRHSGYHMGEQLWEPRAANPLGFFEDAQVNSLNERLLSSVTPWRPRGRLGNLPVLRGRPGWLQRWLADVALDTPIRATRELEQRIAAATSHTPFCLKDPRFCYTLPAWRPFLADPLHICVFRNPLKTAESIMREVGEAPYLRNLYFTHDRAVQVWLSMYSHVLRRHRYHGDWLFVHYDSVTNGTALATLESASGAQIDRQFPNPQLSRSTDTESCPVAVRETYAELCELAIVSR